MNLKQLGYKIYTWKHESLSQTSLADTYLPHHLKRLKQYYSEAINQQYPNYVH